MIMCASMPNTVPKLHVVAGVITNSQGEVLLARRPDHLDEGGLWEFPGGKRERGETVKQTLCRELWEELGITVQQARPLISVIHTNADKTIFLDVWRVEQWEGQPTGCEGQTVQWCNSTQLLEKTFPTANYPVVTAVQLPSLYAITPEPIAYDDNAFFYRLETCLASGTSLIQLRAKTLSQENYKRWAERALTLGKRYKARMLVNNSPEVVEALGAQGIHLNSYRLRSCQERPAQPWVAASCHSIEEVQQANNIGVDFIVISPVQPTISHPDIKPLGWFQFFQLTEQANCPAFALGGMNTRDLPKAWAHGGQGIAAIRALWG